MILPMASPDAGPKALRLLQEALQEQGKSLG
jgi:hypothetical protein